MKSITATEFKARCLEILDHVPVEGIAVTKRGKKVAEVYPAKRKINDLFGSAPDIVVNGADVFSTGLKWNAES